MPPLFFGILRGAEEGETALLFLIWHFGEAFEETAARFGRPLVAFDRVCENKKERMFFIRVLLKVARVRPRG